MLAQIIDMPVQAFPAIYLLSQSPMAVQSAGQTTRPKSAPDIDVIAGWEVELPQLTDADGLGPGKAQYEGICARIFWNRLIS
jgi:hypothetical protein